MERERAEDGERELRMERESGGWHRPHHARGGWWVTHAGLP